MTDETDNDIDVRKREKVIGLVILLFGLVILLVIIVTRQPANNNSGQSNSDFVPEPSQADLVQKQFEVMEENNNVPRPSESEYMEIDSNLRTQQPESASTPELEVEEIFKLMEQNN